MTAHVVQVAPVGERVHGHVVRFTVEDGADAREGSCKLTVAPGQPVKWRAVSKGDTRDQSDRGGLGHR
jgi:hypothetical protein